MTNVIAREQAGAPASTSRSHAWRRPASIAPALVVILAVAAAIAPGIFTSSDPAAISPSSRLQPPSLDHPFGTDQLGRDELARIIFGTQASLVAAAIAVAIAMIVGGLIGVCAGYLGGWLDHVAMRIIDVALAVPSLLLSMTVIAATGGGTVILGIAVGIAGIAAAARILRSRTMQLRSAAFVESALVSGWRQPIVVAKHVLPHTWPTAAAVASVEFGQAVLAVAALGFLGFGPTPPTPEWGAMVADSRAFLTHSWWLTVIPTVVIMAVVLAAYRLSRLIDGDTDARY